MPDVGKAKPLARGAVMLIIGLSGVIEDGSRILLRLHPGNSWYRVPKVSHSPKLGDDADDYKIPSNRSLTLEAQV